MASNYSNVSQLPCAVAFAGTYPPPFCMRESKISKKFHPREVNLSDDGPAGTNPVSTNWRTDSGERTNGFIVWIAVAAGLLILASIIALCYRCCKGLKRRCRRRDVEIAAQRPIGEEEMELSSTPRSHSVRKYKQRKERKAAQGRVRREQDQTSRASSGVQTLGVIINERELHDSERSHENLVTGVR